MSSVSLYCSVDAVNNLKKINSIMYIENCIFLMLYAYGCHCVTVIVLVKEIVIDRKYPTLD